MAAEKSLQGCRRQTKGLRRNPPLSYLIQACLSEVGVLESPAKLGSLEILDILAQHERKRIK